MKRKSIAGAEISDEKRTRSSNDDKALHRFLLGRVESDPWSKQLHLQVTRNPFATNPHSAQANTMRAPLRIENSKQILGSVPCYTDFPFTRALSLDAPKSELYISKGDVEGNFTVIHWGQMKLLMSEIEFLTPYYGQQDMTVVYAGAAPGLHIPLLAEMFETFTFELYDPSPFGIEEGDRIRIFNETFTVLKAEEIATRYDGSDAKLVFISDIRTAPSEEENNLKKTNPEDYYRMSQARIKLDMDQQQDWHLIMQPWQSMLKFRLPWDSGSTTYLAGKIHFSVWGPIYSHETRLITFARPNHLDRMSFDHKTYMLQLSYFNTITRTCLFEPNPYHEALEYGCRLRCQRFQRGLQPALTAIDHCYDCTAHLHIVTLYVAAKLGIVLDSSDTTVTKEISSIVNETIEHIEDKLSAAQFHRGV